MPGDTDGTQHLKMCISPITIRDPRFPSDRTKHIAVACGKCVECMRSISTEWAVRIMLEARCHVQNCCVTLTYDSVHLPRDSLLNARDTQLWLKRLRKYISPQKVRFFLSGEYGDLRGRPHYHVILFGYSPPDLVYFFTKNGNDYFKSKIIADTWQNGNIVVTNLTFDAAFYTAKYMQKLLFSDKEVPPFVRMSNRPGIGFDAIDGKCVATDKIYFNGRSYRVPRYFLKVLEREGVCLEDLKLNRAVNASRFVCSTDELFARQRRSENLLKEFRKRS